MRSARSRVSTQISWPRWKRSDILAAALAVLITIYGGLLRFEALHGNALVVSGRVDQGGAESSSCAVPVRMASVTTAMALSASDG